MLMIALMTATDGSRSDETATRTVRGGRSGGWCGGAAGISGLVAAAAVWAPLAAAAPVVAASDSAESETGLTEITVTAEKYKSTIQDTPISLSAMTGDQLDAEGITTVEALAREVPGLSVRSAGPAETEYEARGLASNGGA